MTREPVEMQGVDSPAPSPVLLPRLLDYPFDLIGVLCADDGPP